MEFTEEELVLVRSDVLARLQAVDKKNEDLARDLDTAWAEREEWKRRAEKAEHFSAEPMVSEVLSADSARPHESLIWAMFFCEATQVVRARPIDSPWITTPAEVAEEMFDEWRARWPEESK